MQRERKRNRETGRRGKERGGGSQEEARGGNEWLQWGAKECKETEIKKMSYEVDKEVALK